MTHVSRTALSAIVLLAASIQAAAAQTTSIPEIQQGGTNVESIVTYCAWIGCVIGVAWGATHFFRHRDDLWSSGVSIIGGLLAGYIATHATTILGWSATASVF